MKSRKPTKSDAWVGRIIDGRFELLQMIARGGSGDVYRAIQRPVGRIVAIKILNPESSGSETRFRELFFLQACLSARLIHPHIVRIFDYGCDGRTSTSPWSTSKGRPSMTSSPILAPCYRFAP